MQVTVLQVPRSRALPVVCRGLCKCYAGYARGVQGTVQMIMIMSMPRARVLPVVFLFLLASIVGRGTVFYFRLLPVRNLLPRSNSVKPDPSIFSTIPRS
jgi:hypothetical protein